MMAMVKLHRLIILAGIIFLCMGAWQYIQTNHQTDSSLQEAKAMAEKQARSNPPQEHAKQQKPEAGKAAGLLEIPRIDSELAIIEGTDPDDLEKGVGHYEGSSYPGENGQIVLSGHRDTVFRRLGELEIGDVLDIAMPYGKTRYKIVKTKIVEPDDKSIITLQKKHEELIVTTCYPFSFVGNAPKRYIIYAVKDNNHKRAD